MVFLKRRWLEDVTVERVKGVMMRAGVRELRIPFLFDLVRLRRFGWGLCMLRIKLTRYDYALFIFPILYRNTIRTS